MTRDVPADFEDFWASTLKQTRALPLEARFEPAWMRAISVYDVNYRGFEGRHARAWLAMPSGTTTPLPCVVEFPGYSKGRGLPHECLLYAAAGYAHLMMDVWEQAGRKAGSLTLGVLDPHEAYYRGVIADAVRAVEAAGRHPLVDSERIAVTGISQGGGLALAVAALVPDVLAVAPDVPFLCDFRRGAELATAGPYQEIVQYLAVRREDRDRVFETLGYFDGVNFAERAHCRALFSVALMDASCPPSTVYAAYDAYAGRKSVEVYPYNGHEGGEAVHDAARLRFLGDIFGR